MDFLNKVTGSKKEGSAQSSNSNPSQQHGGSGGGIMGKINNAMGGGAQGEKNEDYVDKGVDWVQEHVMGQGPQNNESAVEQAKDEQISDAIRRQYKNMTGKDVPIKDKS